ncbi:GntR family transcriptional regulator [Paramicrobacterium agarici]|uniref:DNA-binding transcriptional regulator YhcF (GntR family) n=1 Tax=Paramicrobacterium agarici TaxID=630514 RepID=A0A2A9DU45_9MICO|nr:GntR family transcriptional regulator [Microbacterium agarici]PFG30123.1 DNA-binding transcriptional regulator YhcF (GntR family) [Microbacterium agarici]TQO23130.1 DNA-binding transcriptional regulator YhcF (GntR family) [Microbacterium agarici]
MLDEGRPLFVQIAEQIENDILDGTYPEETAVPSTNELANFLRINPATAGKGLNRLVDSGVLYKRRGIGMFVAAGAKQTLMEARRQSFSDEYIVPLMQEAAKLGISADELTELITKEARS